MVQRITYNENNDPINIDGTIGDYSFGYGLTEVRQIMNYGGNFLAGLQKPTFVKYLNEDGSFEIIRNRATGKEKHIIYVGGTPYTTSVTFIKNFTETKGSFKFLHKDYLGTILAISDEAGNAVEKRHFDAWGNFTHLQKGTGSIINS